MIKEMQLDNIQGHKDTYLELSDGVTIVKGTSSGGKSSIIRGFKWFLTNKLPQKGEIKNWDASEKDGCSFSVSTAEGAEVSRIKNKEFNGYAIVKGEDYFTFEATGKEVPEEIKKVIQMDTCNLLSQEDGYHFLTDSPGEVARKLNERLGLSVIDEKKKKATNLVKDYKYHLKVTNENIQTNRDRIKELGWLREANPLLKEVNALEAYIVNIGDTALKMIHDSKNITQLQDKIAKSNMILRMGPICTQATELQDTIKKMDVQIDSMIDLFNSAVEAEEAIEKAEKLIKLKSDIEYALKIEQELSEIDFRLSKMRSLYRSVSDLRSVLKIDGRQLQELVAQKDKIMSEITECPHCGADKKHWTKEIE